MIELLTAMSLLLIALAMFTAVLSNVQRTSARQDQLGRAGDAAYQALAEMDRQLRSGYIGSETPLDPSFIDTVRIYTEAYATPSTLATPNTVARCVAWVVMPMVDGGEGLYTVWWTPGLAGGGAGAPTYSVATRSFTFPSVTGVARVYGSRLITSELKGSDASTFVVRHPYDDADLGERLDVTLRLREATDPALTASPASGSPSPWVNTISTTLTARNAPRATMAPDTGISYTVARQALCG